MSISISTSSSLRGSISIAPRPSLTPRFITAEPPTGCRHRHRGPRSARRVIRTRRRLGSLEAGTDDVVATGHDPRRDAAPRSAPARWPPRGNSASPVANGPGSRCGAWAQALAWAARRLRCPVPAVPACRVVPCTPIPRSPRTGATSWSGSSGIPPVGPCPWSACPRTPTATSSTPSPTRGPDGTTGIRLSPLELVAKLAALVPLPRMPLVRDGGCLAPHSHRRGAIIPTPRQQGMVDDDTRRRVATRELGAAASNGCLPWTWRAARFASKGRGAASRPARRAR